jgi:hypothetical protein
LDVGEAGEVTVVEADDRDLVGHRDTGAQEGVEDADGAVVVEGEDGGGAGSLGEECSCGCRAVVLGQPARHEADAVGEAVVLHGRLVAAAPVGRARRPAAVDVGDVLVPEINYPAVARVLEEIGYGGTVAMQAWASGDSELALERFRSAFTLSSPEPDSGNGSMPLS